jgi:hypothetical protein
MERKSSGEGLAEEVQWESHMASGRGRGRQRASCSVWVGAGEEAEAEAVDA